MVIHQVYEINCSSIATIPKDKMPDHQSDRFTVVKFNLELCDADNYVIEMYITVSRGIN